MKFGSRQRIASRAMLAATIGLVLVSTTGSAVYAQPVADAAQPAAEELVAESSEEPAPLLEPEAAPAVEPASVIETPAPEPEPATTVPPAETEPQQAPAEVPEAETQTEAPAVAPAAKASQRFSASEPLIVMPMNPLSAPLGWGRVELNANVWDFDPLQHDLVVKIWNRDTGVHCLNTWNPQLTPGQGYGEQRLKVTCEGVAAGSYRGSVEILERDSSYQLDYLAAGTGTTVAAAPVLESAVFTPSVATLRDGLATGVLRVTAAGSGVAVLVKFPGSQEIEVQPNAELVYEQSFEVSSAGAYTAEIRLVHASDHTVEAGRTTATFTAELPEVLPAFSLDPVADIYAGSDLSVRGAVTDFDPDKHQLFVRVFQGDDPVGDAQAAEVTDGSWSASIADLPVGDYALRVWIETADTATPPISTDFAVSPTASIVAVQFVNPIDWVHFDGAIDATVSGTIADYNNDFSALLTIDGKDELLAVAVNDEGQFSTVVPGLAVGSHQVELSVCLDGALTARGALPETLCDTQSATFEAKPVPALTDFAYGPDKESLLPGTSPYAEHFVEVAFGEELEDSPFSATLQRAGLADTQIQGQLTDTYQVTGSGSYKAQVVLTDTRTEEAAVLAEKTISVVAEPTQLLAAWDNAELMIETVGQGADAKLQGVISGFDEDFYEVRVKFDEDEPVSLPVEDGVFEFEALGLDEGTYSTTVVLWNTEYDAQVGSELVLPLIVSEYQPEVRLSKTEIVQGEEFTISGRGWPGTAQVSHSLHSTPVKLLDPVVVNSDGTYSVQAVLPADATPGEHHVVATSNTGHEVRFAVTVKSKPSMPIPAAQDTPKAKTDSGLANTGASTDFALLAAACLATLGLAFVGYRRKRALAA